MSDSFDQQYENYFEKGEIEAVENPKETTDSNETETIDDNTDSEPTIIQLDTDKESSNQEESTSTDNESDETGKEESKQDDKSSEIANNLKLALKEERTKRQDLDRQFKDLQQQSHQIKEALNSLLSPQAQKQQQEQAPNYEEDPVGYLKWQQDQITQHQQQQQQYLTQQQQQQQAYQQAVNLNNEYLQEKSNYIKENPEFDNAAQFLESSVLNEYKALGYSDQQAQQLLVQDKISLLSTAKQKQISSPELIMQIAEARGYQKSNNQNASPAVSKLETVKKGIKHSKSLGSSGGESTKKNISLQELSNLDDKEFEKVFDQYASGNLQIS